MPLFPLPAISFSRSFIVMLIVNVNESVRRFGCVHQNLINYCIIPCFIHEIYFACYSLKCFKTSCCVLCSICVFFFSILFLFLSISLLHTFLSTFSHTFSLRCAIVTAFKLMNSRESQLYPKYQSLFSYLILQFAFLLSI